MKSPLAALSAQLDGLMLRDRQRLQRRLQGAIKINDSQALQGHIYELQMAIQQCLQ